ncbi:MAG TPA: siroheme synthase CysG, partial [Pseudomonadales bacterium]|nr:siroheme synthase CysG [Pseudomonadales bacterium]
MDYLPINLNIRQQRCLVVGGGDVAARKAGLLLRAGAYLRVVAPVVSETMKQLLAESPHHQLHLREFMPSDMEHVALVVTATDHRLVNEEVSQLARMHHIPVNVVDQPDLCTFVLPSIVDRSPVTIAVSSGGSSPVLARTLRAKIETMVPAAYGRLAQLVGNQRGAVKEKFVSTQERRQFWEVILEGPVAELVFAGREDEARELLENILASGAQPNSGVGEVYLIGAGPGDPDLLTFRALRLMQQADVVLYDRLVSAPVLELVRREADRIYVGKARSNHAVPQEEINEMLVRLAKEGKRVCRLK